MALLVGALAMNAKADAKLMGLVKNCLHMYSEHIDTASCCRFGGYLPLMFS